MIDVHYDRKGHSLTVKGHAKSGEPGHDIVCAAASILTYTLAADVLTAAEKSRDIRRPKVKLKEGDSHIAVSAVHGMDTAVTMIFDSVCAGFSLLARNYGEFIQYAEA